MSPTNRHKYKYFHSTVQRAKDRRQKFHFCRLPFDVRPRNVKLINLPNMSTERANNRPITVHALFLAIAPNQKSLSQCCMETLSHWPEMKNSGRCSPWNFTIKYCAYTCHTLHVYSGPKVPLRPLYQTFLRSPKQYFVFVSSPKNKPTQTTTIVLTLSL